MEDRRSFDLVSTITGDEIYFKKIYIHILDSFYLVLISTFNKSLFVSVSCLYHRFGKLQFYRIWIHAFLVKMNIIMHQFIQQVTSANDTSDNFTVPSCTSTEDVKRYQERTIWSAALLWENFLGMMKDRISPHKFDIVDVLPI